MEGRRWGGSAGNLMTNQSLATMSAYSDSRLTDPQYNILSRVHLHKSTRECTALRVCCMALPLSLLFHGNIIQTLMRSDTI